MTRKGKVGVKCFLVKAIVAALEKETLWIRSTRHTSSIPNPRRTVFCTLPILWYENSGFFNPFLAPCLLDYYCSYKSLYVAMLSPSVMMSRKYIARIKLSTTSKLTKAEHPKELGLIS